MSLTCTYNNLRPASKLVSGWHLILVIIILCSSTKLFAQEQIIRQPFMAGDSALVTPRHRIRLRDTMVNRKRFGRAAIELGFAELTPWSIDNFFRKVDYTKISWKTTGYNLNPGHWDWDNDNFQTNQFGHPYHGSFYYSTLRTNGYTFWQSVPAAFVGSYLWETFAENQAPAPNDFINTSFGGVVLGEMTYRLSNKIINNHRRGFRRQASEVLGLIVNPMNGLNRILDGKWGRVSANPKEVDSSAISAQFDVGVRKFNENLGGALHGHVGWFARASLLYGTPYEKFKEPFSNINVTAELGRDDSTMLNIVSVYGSLTGWELMSRESQKQLIILSANYDYIHNVAFFYGGQSVKFNLYSEYKLSSKIKINTLFGAGPVILAAVPDVYIYKGRNYDYGSGFAVNAGGKLSIMDKLFLSLSYRGGWTETLNGNPSHYFLHALSAEVSYMLVKNLSVNAEPGYFALKGYYNKFPNVDRSYPYLRTSVRYNVNL